MDSEGLVRGKVFSRHQTSVFQPLNCEEVVRHQCLLQPRLLVRWGMAPFEGEGKCPFCRNICCIEVGRGSLSLLALVGVLVSWLSHPSLLPSLNELEVGG